MPRPNLDSSVSARPGWPVAAAVLLLVAASCAPESASLSTLDPANDVSQAGRTAEVARPSPLDLRSTADNPEEVDDNPEEVTDRPEPSASRSSEPDPAPAPPEPIGELGDAEVRRPSVRVDGLEGTAAELLDAALADEQVSFATPVARSRTVVGDAAGRPHELGLAAVDPEGLRLLVPEVTAQETAVWQRLAEGDAVMDYRAAERLEIGLGEELSIPDRPPLRVGAFVETGRPPVADIIVSTGRGRSLGAPEPNALLAATVEDAPASQAALDLEKRLGGRAVALIAEPGSGGPREAVNLPTHLWTRLAQCESSGNWQADTGNGYYGGLQFLPESWWWVGGAGMPHEASREEQIYRAEILFSVQGWDAWPACAEKLGLRELDLTELTP